MGQISLGGNLAYPRICSAFQLQDLLATSVLPC